MTHIVALSQHLESPSVVTNTFQAITKTYVLTENESVIESSRNAPFLVDAPYVQHLNQSLYFQLGTPRPILEKHPDWRDPEYRQAYLSSSIEQGLAWQIRTNRKLRNMSQEDLAQAIGTQQSGISRLEDPTYGAHSLETLVSIANAFDCALSVRFVSYSALAHESEDLSPQALYAKSYEEEYKTLENI